MQTKFEMTAAHLARTLESTRKRERLNVARRIEMQADIADSKGDHAHARELRELAEEVKMGTMNPAVVPAAGVSGGEPDPLDAVDEVVAEAERGSHDGLPPVYHMSDEAEGLALVKNLGARGRLNIPRD